MHVLAMQTDMLEKLGLPQLNTASGTWISTYIRSSSENCHGDQLQKRPGPHWLHPQLAQRNPAKNSKRGIA